MMIKHLRDVLRAFYKEHATTQIKLHKSKLLVYDEFLKKYVSIDELLIPGEVYKEKDDIALLRKKSRELLLIDLLLKKFVNPKLDLLTPVFLKDQLPNVFRSNKYDNSYNSSRQYFWKKKKKAAKNHNIPALPPVHDTKGNNKKSNSSTFGWAGQPTQSPETDPRPELSNTSCNIDPSKDPKKSKPPKKKKQNKQLKVCGKDKQEKKDSIEQSKPVVFQEDECYHKQNERNELKMSSQKSLHSLNESFEETSLRPTKKEKFNLFEICTQLFANRKCEVKEKFCEKSNSINKNYIEINNKKNSTLKNKQISTNVKKPSKINNICSDSEAKLTLSKCNSKISKTPQKNQFNEKTGTKKSISDLKKTVSTGNSAKLCDTSENVHSKSRTIKQKDIIFCSHKLDKPESCNSKCKSENDDSNVNVVNTKECLNGKSATVYSNTTANKPIKSDCKKDFHEETKPTCRQLTPKSKYIEPVASIDPVQNCNSMQMNYNFMVIPKSMKYSSSLKNNFKIETDNYCNNDINGELKATSKFTDEKSIKTDSKTINRDGNKCFKNIQTTKAKNQSSANKDCFTKKEQTCKSHSQIIKTTASLPDLNSQPCTQQHREDKKMSSSKVIRWKGLEFGLKNPNDIPKKQCNKVQKSLTISNKNNSTGKSQCLHIEPTVSEKLESITQERCFDKVDHSKDLSKHKSDTYMGFKIKKTCEKESKSQRCANSLTKTECNSIKTKTKIAKKSKSKVKGLKSMKQKCPSKSIKSDQCLTENKKYEYDKDSKKKELTKSLCLKNKTKLEEKSLQCTNENVDEKEFPCGEVRFSSCDEHKPLAKELCTTVKGDLDTKDCSSTEAAEVKDLCSSKPEKGVAKNSKKVNNGKDKSSPKKKKEKHNSKKSCKSVITTISKTRKNKSKTCGTISKNNSQENIIKKDKLIKRAASCKSLKTQKQLHKSMSAVICQKTSVKSAQSTTKFKDLKKTKASVKKTFKQRKNNKEICNICNCGEGLTEIQRNSSRRQTTKTIYPSCEKPSQTQDTLEKKTYDTNSFSKGKTKRNISSTSNASFTKNSRSGHSVIRNKTAHMYSLQNDKNRAQEDPLDSNKISVKSFSQLKPVNHLDSNNKANDFVFKKSNCNEEVQIKISQTPETAKVLIDETRNRMDNSSNLSDTAILKHKVEWYIKSPINYLQERALKAGEPKGNETLTLNSIKYKHHKGIFNIRKRFTGTKNKEVENSKLNTLQLKDKSLLYDGNKLKDENCSTKVEDSKIFDNSNQNDKRLKKKAQTNMGSLQINHLHNLVNYNDSRIVGHKSNKAEYFNNKLDKSSNDVTDVGSNSRQLYQRGKNNQITHTLMKTTRVTENNQSSKVCSRGTTKITDHKINIPTKDSKCGPLNCNKFSQNVIPSQNRNEKKSTNTKNKYTPTLNLTNDQNAIKTFQINLGPKSKTAETRIAKTRLPFISEQNHYKNEVTGVNQDLKLGIKKCKLQTQGMKSSILHDKKNSVTIDTVTNNYINSNKNGDKLNFSRPKTSYELSNHYMNKVQNRENLIKYSEMPLIDLKSTDQQKVHLKGKTMNSSTKNKNISISNEWQNKGGVEDTNKNNLDHLKNNQKESLVSGKTFVIDKRLRKIIKKNAEFNKKISKLNFSEVQRLEETGKFINATNNKLLNKTVVKEFDFQIKDGDKQSKERNIVVLKNKVNTETERQNDQERCNYKGLIPTKETSQSSNWQTIGKTKNNCISVINRNANGGCVESSLNKSKK